MNKRIPNKEPLKSLVQNLIKNTTDSWDLSTNETNITTKTEEIEEKTKEMRTLEKDRKQLSSLAKSIRSWQDFEHLSAQEQKDFETAHRQVMTGPGWSFGYDKARRSALDTSQVPVQALLNWREEAEVILTDPKATLEKKKELFGAFKKLNLTPYQQTSNQPLSLEQKRFNVFLDQVQKQVSNEEKKLPGSWKKETPTTFFKKVFQNSDSVTKDDYAIIRNFFKNNPRIMSAMKKVHEAMQGPVTRLNTQATKDKTEQQAYSQAKQDLDATEEEVRQLYSCFSLINGRLAKRFHEKPLIDTPKNETTPTDPNQIYGGW